eukprot:c47234_g1_i1 orf=482-754(+)
MRSNPIREHKILTNPSASIMPNPNPETPESKRKDYQQRHQWVGTKREAIFPSGIPRRKSNDWQREQSSVHGGHTETLENMREGARSLSLS